MAAINVGATASDRAGGRAIYTPQNVVNKGGPCTDAGSIDTIEIWFVNGGTVSAASYTDNTGNNLTCVDAETLGVVTAGSKQTISGLSISINSGDYIGCVGTAGSASIEADASGYSGIWADNSLNLTPSTSYDYSWFLSGDAVSLYGTGSTAGWANIAKVSGVASGDLAKIDGVLVADIAKINGVAV